MITKVGEKRGGRRERKGVKGEIEKVWLQAEIP